MRTRNDLVCVLNETRRKGALARRHSSFEIMQVFNESWPA